MISLYGRTISIIVIISVILHLVWAVALMGDHSALDATALSSIYRYIASPELIVLALTIAAGLALIGISTTTPWIVLLLLPQQCLLMMSAAGAIEAMYLGQFADGILRPHAFIIVDQLYSILIALGHTAAIIIHAVRIGR